MANLNEVSQYDAGVYQLEVADPVSGGPAGFSNKPLINLANRTNYLKTRVDKIETNLVDKTITNSAATGAVALDVSLASIFVLGITGGVTGMTVTNSPVLTGETLSFVVRVTQGATAYALTWFTGITWLTTGGTAPAAPAAGKTIEYIFSSTATGVYLGRKGAST